MKLLRLLAPAALLAAAACSDTAPVHPTIPIPHQEPLPANPTIPIPGPSPAIIGPPLP